MNWEVPWGERPGEDEVACLRNDIEKLWAENEKLREALRRIVELGEDTSTEFFNGYLADVARKALEDET